MRRRRERRRGRKRRKGKIVVFAMGDQKEGKEELVPTELLKYFCGKL